MNGETLEHIDDTKDAVEQKSVPEIVQERRAKMDAFFATSGERIKRALKGTLELGLNATAFVIETPQIAGMGARWTAEQAERIRSIDMKEVASNVGSAIATGTHEALQAAGNGVKSAAEKVAMVGVMAVMMPIEAAKAVLRERNRVANEKRVAILAERVKAKQAAAQADLDEIHRRTGGNHELLLTLDKALF